MKITALLNKPTPTDRVLAAAESVPAGEVLTGHELAAKMGISHGRFIKYALDPRVHTNRYKASQGVPAYWGSRKTIQVLKKRMK